MSSMFCAFGLLTIMCRAVLCVTAFAFNCALWPRQELLGNHWDHIRYAYSGSSMVAARTRSYPTDKQGSPHGSPLTR